MGPLTKDFSFAESLHTISVVTAQAIETFLNAKPFRSFQLVTASGESYTIPHPDFFHFSPTRRTCNVYAADGEFFSTLDMLTLTDIQPNGRGRTRRTRRHRE
jgi:hypothetical protein